MKVKFGWIVKKIRISKGMSQHDLAVILEISRSHIGRLENGEKQPSLNMIFKIAEALGVTASSIIAAMEGQETLAINKNGHPEG